MFRWIDYLFKHWRRGTDKGRGNRDRDRDSNGNESRSLQNTLVRLHSDILFIKAIEFAEQSTYLSELVCDTHIWPCSLTGWLTHNCMLQKSWIMDFLVVFIQTLKSDAIVFLNDTKKYQINDNSFLEKIMKYLF